MKTIPLALILLLTSLDLWAQTTTRQAPTRIRLAPPVTNSPAADPAIPVTPVAPITPITTIPAPTPAAAATDPAVNVADPNTPSAAPAPPEEMIQAGMINFQGVDVNEVLKVYGQLVGRTLLRAGLPAATITLKTETALTKSEAIQALQAVLALNGISVINIDDKFVKVLPIDQANTAGAEFNDASTAQLPNLGTYVTRIVQLKNLKPTEVVPIIQPFAKLANSILPIDANGILVLRDNAENVKRMLQMIERVDVSVPAEYISEVIPIKYALADDIANALNSLGGSGGGSTVSFGGASGATTGARTTGGTTGFGSGIGGGTSGFGNTSSGIGGTQQRGFGTTAGGTTAGSTASSFQSRLNNIIQRASGPAGQDTIQVFGQTKIIADARSNSLLIFATRQDMVNIKSVVEKLDVLLSQVLIESIIMEVSYGKTLDTAFSAVQRASAINGGNPTNANFVGAGGYNNSGAALLDLLKNGVAGSVGSNTLSGGFSYFGAIADSDYSVLMRAVATDDSITIIQKPRIQTFQAQPASFFVGSTVPYVTSTYNGGTTGIGSSYSQLSVGVSLEVTPFINPDGLVVMQIREDIDNISGFTTIDGNPVPNTSKKSLSSNVAVKDRDSIILGGAIYSSKSLSKSGVPLLQDIPLLGALFSSRSSDKQRQELLVLIRPTVLKTPELAALQAKKEEARSPGIHQAQAQDAKEEQKQVEAEAKLQKLQDEKDAKAAAKAAAKAKKSGASTQPAGQTTAPVTTAPTVN